MRDLQRLCFTTETAQPRIFGRSPVRWAIHSCRIWLQLIFTSAQERCAVTATVASSAILRPRLSKCAHRDNLHLEQRCDFICGSRVKRPPRRLLGRMVEAYGLSADSSFSCYLRCDLLLLGLEAGLSLPAGLRAIESRLRCRASRMFTTGAARGASTCVDDLPSSLAAMSASSFSR